VRDWLAYILIILATAATGTISAAVEAPDSEIPASPGMQIIYPGPGEVTETMDPTIAVDMTGLKTPVETTTVSIVLDGADVTSFADVTPSYILYKPPVDLPAGNHTVTVKAMDTTKKDIPPLEWSFKIPDLKPVKTDNTTGRLTMSTDYGRADFQPSSMYDVNEIIAEKEGMKLNVDLDFTNISEGRTIIGSIHRETQDYTDIEIDRGRIDYYDSDIEASLGYFWIDLSEFTVAGTELGGIRVDRDNGPWHHTFFGGRTQDPSTSGTYKQFTTGFKTSYTWSSSNNTSLTLLDAQEKDNPFYNQLPGNDPARDQIASLMHQFNFNKKFYAVLEAAKNKRRISSASTKNDSAVKLKLKGTYEIFTTEFQLYDIDENFFPVAGGNAKFLYNNREGFMGKVTARPIRWLTAGGLYEEYDSAEDSVTDPEKETKRKNAFVALSPGRHVNITYRKNNLSTSEQTESDTDSVTATLSFTEGGYFTKTRLSAGWNDIEYTDTGSPMQIFIDNTIFSLGFRTTAGNRLDLSASYSKSDVDAIMVPSSTTTKKYSYGLDWYAIPRRLTWSWDYSQSDSSGTSVDTDETTLKTLIEYVSNREFTYTLGWDTISHTNAINPSFNYDEDIWRSGVKWNF